jgi:hypothetical protein
MSSHLPNQSAFFLEKNEPIIYRKEKKTAVKRTQNKPISDLSCNDL